MAIGKNKRIAKSKKGGKKKIGDPFLKKEWYDCKAPSLFAVRSFGNTLVTKSQGTRLAADGLKGRVFEVNLADLTNDEDQGFRKVKLSVEDVQGRNCLTDVHGLGMTRHHLCSLIKKHHTLIEAHFDVKTLDGYSLRVFVMAISKRHSNQLSKNCYIQTSKVKLIRKKMIETMYQEINSQTFKDFVRKFPLPIFEKMIRAATKNLFPLNHIYVRKVKVLKKPKFDITKLMELHGDLGEDAGKTVEGVPENADAVNLLTAEVEAGTVTVAE